MRKSRFTEAQIIGMIKEQESGLPTSELCRKHGLSPAMFYKLKAKYGGMDLSEAKRLKRLLADAMLENVVLKDLLECPDDAGATAGRGAAGDEGSSDLSTPGLRPDRCRPEDCAA